MQKQTRLGLRRSWTRRGIMHTSNPRLLLVVAGAFLLASSTLMTSAMVVEAASPTGRGGAAPASESKASTAQDPSFVAAKNAGLVHKNAQGVPVIETIQPQLSPPSSYLLSTTAGQIAEPWGTGYDDHHVGHPEDLNYWSFCGAGAATVTSYYWPAANVTSHAAGSFTEPYGPHKQTTYWAASDTGGSADSGEGFPTIGRSYLMYMAEKVQPPIFGTPGIDVFTFYPTHGATLSDAKYAINWEISGHSSSYQNYFYVWQDSQGSNWTPSALHFHATWDISLDHAPVMVDVDTAYLPNWGTSHIPHSIAIIGYDDIAGTYTYVDTCMSQCRIGGGSQNTGTYTYSQSSMWIAMTHGLMATAGWGYLH